MSFIGDLVAAMVEGFVTGVVEALVEVWKEIEEWVSDLFTQLKRVWDDVIFEGQKTADGLARFDEKFYYQKILYYKKKNLDDLFQLYDDFYL